MNCQQAKKIPIVGYLASQGIRPENVKNDSVWYCSPLRKETRPSFKVYHSQNIWYDYGLGKGGNILDLVMEMNNTGVAGALLALQEPGILKNFSFPEQQNSNNSKLEIKKIQPLQNRALIDYLVSRKISYYKAVDYVNEAYYRVCGRNYFALTLENDKGGFELRSKYFKGSSSPKAIRTIPGNQFSVNIFEGFFDFLSALEYYRYKKPAATTIILNSINNLDNIINRLKKFRKINLYLDNDNAGQLTANKLQSTFPDIIKDYSKIIYPDYNDFNDFLINYKQKGKL